MNNFPISVKQIAEGMNNASSALSAGGNSLNESIALLAAANVTVQNASKSSTALRTITARLRNSKAELDELGEEVMTTAKYQQLLDTLTKNNVEIVDKATGKYNSTYKIMSQLAAVWDDLNDGIKATLTTQLSGVRNIDVFSSVLKNFKDVAEGAMDAMSNGAGALSDAYGEYLNTAEAHLNSLKAAWQELAMDSNIVSLVKTVADAGKELVGLLSTVASSGAVQVVFETINAVVKLTSAILGLVNATGLLKPIMTALVTGGLLKGAATLVGLLAGKLTSLGAVGTHLSVLASSISGLIGPISAVVGVTALFVKILQSIPSAEERARKKAEQYVQTAADAKNEISELNDTLSKNRARRYELNKLKDAGSITDAEEKELELIQDANVALERRIGLKEIEIKKNQELADSELQKEWNALQNGIILRDSTLAERYQDYQMYLLNGMQDRAEELSERFKLDQSSNTSPEIISFEKWLENAVQRYQELNAYQEIGLELTGEMALSLDSYGSDLLSWSKTIERIYGSLSDQDTDFARSLKSMIDVLDPVINSIAPMPETFTDAKDDLEDYAGAVSDAKDALEDLKDAYDVIAKAEKETEQGNGISYDTLKSLMKLTDNYNEYLYEENGHLKVRLDLLKQEADLSYQNDVTSIRNGIAKLKADIKSIEESDLYKSIGGISTGAYESMRQSIASMNAEIEQSEEQLKYLEAVHNTVVKSVKENPFAKQLEEHKHMIAMERETTEEYIEWLKDASKKAYEDGWLSADEYKKYEEEVFKETPKLADSLKNLGSAYDTLYNARKEYDETGKLSAETIESIISSTEKYTDVLDVENGEIKLNEEAWIDYYTTKYNLAKQDAVARKESLQSTRDQLASEKERMESMGYNVDSIKENIATIDGEIAELDEKVEIYDEMVAKVSTKNLEDVWGNLSGYLSGVSKLYDVMADARDEMANSGKLSYDTVESLLSISPDYIRFLQTENGQITLNSSALKEYADAKAQAKISEVTEEIEKLQKQLSVARESGLYKKAEGIQEQIDEFEEMRDVYEAMLVSAKETTTLSDAISELGSSYDILLSAQSEMAETGKLSISTIESIISATDNYAKILKIENGEIKLNEEAWQEYYSGRYDSARKELEAQLESLEARKRTLAEERALYDSETALDKVQQKRVNRLDDQLTDVQGQIDETNDKLKLYDVLLAEITKRQTKDIWSDLSDALSNVASAYELITTAQQEMADSGGLSIGTVESLLSLSPDYVKFLEVENGKIKLNVDAMREYAKAKNEARVAEIDSEIDSRQRSLLQARADGDVDAIQRLNKEIEELEGFRKVYDTLSKTTANVRDLSDAISELSDNRRLLFDARREIASTGKLSVDTIKSIIEATDNYAKILRVENGEIKLNEEAWKEYYAERYNIARGELEDQLDKLKAKRDDLNDKLGSAAFEDKGGISQELKAVNEEIDETIDKVELFGVLSNEVIKSSADEVWSYLSDAMSETVSVYDLITSAQKEMATSGRLSIETIEGLLAMSSEYVRFLEIENGQIKLNAEGVREYAKAQSQAKIDEINREIEIRQEQIIEAREEGRYGTVERLQQEVSDLRSLKEIYNIALDTADSIRDLSDAITELANNRQILNTARRETASTGKLSVETIESIIAATEDYTKILRVENGEIKLNEEAWEEYYTARYEAERGALEDQLDKLKAKRDDLNDKLGSTAFVDKDSISQELKTVNEEIDKTNEKLELNGVLANEVVKASADDVWSYLSGAISETASAYDLIATAQKEMADAGKLSISTVEGLLSMSSEYVRFLKVENGQIKLNAEGIREYTKAQYEAKIAEIDREIGIREDQILGTEDSGAIENLKQEISDLKALKEIYKAALDAASGIRDLSDAINELSNNRQILNSARREIADTGKLSTDTIESIIAATEDYTKILRVENGEIKLNEEAWEEYYKAKYEAAKGELEMQLSLLKARRDALSADMGSAAADKDSASQELAEIDAAIDETTDKLEIFSVAADNAVKSSTADVWSYLADSISETASAYDLVKTAQKEMINSGSLSAETVESLLSISTDYVRFLKIENGQIKLNAEAMRDFAKAQAESRIAEIDREIATRNTQLLEARRNKDEGSVSSLTTEIDDLKALRSVYETIQETATSIRDLSDAISELSDEHQLLTTARKEMMDNGKLSISTVESIIAATDNYTDMLRVENGEIKLNEEAWLEYSNAKYESAKGELTMQLDLLEAERDVLAAEMAMYSYDTDKLRENTDKISVLDQKIAGLREKLKIFGAMSNDVVRNPIKDIWSNLSSSISETASAYELLSNAQLELIDSDSLSIETVEKLLSISTDYIRFLTIENGKIRLNADAIRDYAKAQAEARVAEIDNEISTVSGQLVDARREKDTELVKELEQRLADLQGIKEFYNLAVDTTNVRELSDAISELVGNHQILANARKEVAENGKLSISTIEAIISATDNYTDILTVENGQIKLNEDAWQDYYTKKYEATKKDIEAQKESKSLTIERLSSEMAKYSNDADALADYTARIGALQEEYKELDDRLLIVDAALNMVTNSVEESKEVMSAFIGKMKDALSDISNTYDAIDKAQEEVRESGTLSRETVESLLSISPEYIRFLEVEGGLIKLNSDALREYAEAQYVAKIGEITDKIADLKTRMEDLRAKGDTEGANEIQNQVSALENEILVYQNLVDALTDGAATIAKTTTYISDIRDSLSDLAGVQEIVTNGFVVAADKVKDLAATFPELFENAKAYADGSMKLDAEVANAFLENRQAETNAAIDARITELEAQLEAVTAKKDLIDAEIELAMEAAQSEAQIDKDVAQYRINNADAAAQRAIDVGASEAEAYAIAAQSIYDNTFDLDTAIAKAASDIATNYGESFASAADASAANALAINTNVDSTTRQIHQAAAAMAGMPGGKIQGAEGVIKPGAVGSRKPSHTASIGMYTDSGTGNVQAMMQGVMRALQSSRVSLDPATFIATYFRSQLSSGSLADLILSKIDESNVLADIQAKLSGQIAILKGMKNVDLSKFKDKEKTKSSSAGSGGSPSTAGSGSGKGENPFDAMYREHQHLLAMEQESVSDYFTWLDKASRDAFNQGWITLDDLRKYEEEVYRGLKEIISDAESAMKDLVDFRVKMLEKEQEDRKDELQAELEILKAFYDDQKKQLQEQREEEEYQKEKAEKQKAVTDIEAELAMLGYDNSAKAQKRRLELQQQLAEAQAAYAEFEKDHAYQLAEDALESAYEKQAGEIQAQIDAIDAILNDPNTLFNQALEDIKNDTGSLYDEMVRFAEENGEGESTVRRLWENAFIATQDLQKVTSENVQTISELLKNLPSDIANLIMGFSLQNSTGYSYTGTGSTASNSAGSSSSGSSSTSGSGSAKIPVGTAVKATGKAYATVKGTGNAVDVTGKQLYVAQVWDNAANPYWQGDYTYAVAYSKGGSIIGWVRKDQLSGYASGTSHATAGLHRVDEKGQEALFVSSDGNHYRLLSDGDKVFNAEATDFLYKLANGDKDIFRDLFSGIFSRSTLNSIANRQSIGDVRMGDIIINGNADKATVSEIRRAQRESVDNLLQQFGRLQRAAY